MFVPVSFTPLSQNYYQTRPKHPNTPNYSLSLPNVNTLVRRLVHGILGLDIKRLVELGHVRQWPVCAEVIGAVRVYGDELFGALIGDVLPPDSRPREKEPLHGGEAVDLGLFAFHSLCAHPFCEGAEGQFEAAEVREVLASGELCGAGSGAWGVSFGDM